MSNTPRTDAVMDTLSLPLSWDALTLAEHARQLERALVKAERKLCKHTFRPHRTLTNYAGDKVVMRTERCSKCGVERELA